MLLLNSQEGAGRIIHKKIGDGKGGNIQCDLGYGVTADKHSTLVYGIILIVHTSRLDVILFSLNK
jgi:hypothetical protein